MIDVITCMKDFDDFVEFANREYAKNPIPLKLESLRVEFTDTPHVYTVDVGEKRLYTVGARLFSGDLRITAKWYETKTANGYKYEFIENNGGLGEDECLSINGIISECMIFLAVSGAINKVNRSNGLESVVFSRGNKGFKAEILRSNARPDVTVYGPELQKLKGRPTGEKQPTFVRIK